MTESQNDTKDFKSFYESKLVPDLERLEVDRKKLSVLAIFSGLIGVVGLLTSLYYFGGFHRFSLDNHSKADFLIALGVLVAWSVVGALFYKYVYTKKLNFIRGDFKRNIIQDIVDFVDPGLGYKEHELISQEDYEASKLFPVKAHEYYGEDYLLGKEGDISYKISELHTQYVMKDHRGRKAFFTVFSGLFFVADVNQNFEGETVVLPDAAKSLFGKFGEKLQQWNILRNEMVKTNDEVFDKNFVVYSDNPASALKILTKELRQRIIDFKLKMNHKVYVSFVGNRLNVAIPLKIDLFEPPVFGSMLNYDSIYENYKYLQLVTGIVHDLKLE